MAQTLPIYTKIKRFNEIVKSLLHCCIGIAVSLYYQSGVVQTNFFLKMTFQEKAAKLF